MKAQVGDELIIESRVIQPGPTARIERRHTSRPSSRS